MSSVIPNFGAPNDQGYIQDQILKQDIEEESFQATLSGPYASAQVVTMRVLRIGKQAWLSIPHFQATSTSSSTITSQAGALPKMARPSRVAIVPMLVFNNGVTMGSVVVDSLGNITIAADVSGSSSFGNGVSVGTQYPITAPYPLLM